jgi:hypothetical protein
MDAVRVAICWAEIDDGVTARVVAVGEDVAATAPCVKTSNKKRTKAKLNKLKRQSENFLGETFLKLPVTLTPFRGFSSIPSANC